MRKLAGCTVLRVEEFTAVTMKNVVFWDIKTHFVPHRQHITSPLQRPVDYCYLRFEVFTTVTMMNAVLFDITLRGSCRDRRFG
jgi:hypothetical protein